MNENPYLHWAKKIRIAFPVWDEEAIARSFGRSNPWVSLLKGGKFPRQHERIRATYNNVAPYTLDDLERPPVETMATNRPGPISYTEHFKAQCRVIRALQRITDVIKREFGNTVTLERIHDELLVTLDTTKI